MSETIATFVTSLGDFPLDPDKGRAWLWSADGSRLLWMSDAAWDGSGHARSAVMPEIIDSHDAERLAAWAPRTDAPVKVETLPLVKGGSTEYAICLTRHERLRAGGVGWLAVAIGAPARSMEAVSAGPDRAALPDAQQSEPGEAHQPEAEAPPTRPVAEAAAPAPPTLAQSPPVDAAAAASSLARLVPVAPSVSGAWGAGGMAPSPVAAAGLSSAWTQAPVTASIAAPVAPSTPVSGVQPALPSSTPAWIGDDRSLVRPLRFVWQTDATGQFVHISRELAESVGTAQAVLIGLTWRECVARFGLESDAQVTEGFASRDTWTAQPVLWPVAGADLAVPVEMAGMLVTEAGRFAGFRGYGIARRELAEAHVRSPAVQDAQASPPPVASPPEALLPEALGSEALPPEELGPRLPAEPAPGIAAAPLSLAPPPSVPLSSMPPLSAPVMMAQPSAPDESIVPPKTVAQAVAQPEAESTPVGVAQAGEVQTGGAQRGEAQAGEAQTETVEPDAAAPERPAAAANPGDAVDASRVQAEFGSFTTAAALFAPAVFTLAAAPPATPPSAERTASVANRAALPVQAEASSAQSDRGEVASAAVPEPAPTPELSMATPDEIEKSLSATERSAFRAIAMALKGMEQAASPAPAESAAPAQPKPAMLPDSDPSTPPAPVPPAPMPFASPVALPAPPIASELEQVLSLLPVGTLIRRSGKLVYANGEALAALGAPSLGSLEANAALSRLLDESQTNGEAAQTGKPAWAVRVIGEGAEARPFELSTQPLRLDGQPAWLGMVRAVRTPAAVAPVPAAQEMALLRQQLGELQTVVDTAADGILWLDSDARILTLNRSGEALFGFDMSEIKDQPLTTLLEPESHAAATDYIDKLKTNTVATLLNDGLEVMGRERHGGRIPLFMTASRVGAEGTPLRFCAVLKDVTIWKKAVADLSASKKDADEANAQKTDFLAKISHEIRTPLNAILGFSQVMQSESFGPLGSERYRQYARDIHASGQHVISLVNDLLDLSKIAAGKLELSFASVDLNEVVSGCVAMIQPQANAAKVIVRSQLVPRLPNVVADERSIRQIVLNLLSNAAKFTEAGGQVIVTTAITDRGEVAIRVRDTGIGMTPDEIKQALEPFRQTAAARSRGGTGLGLPLTKALVEANRAAFSIESEPKSGTMVEVTFPSTRVLAE